MRMIRERSVDFPEPVRPIRAVFLAGGMERLVEWRAGIGLGESVLDERLVLEDVEERRGKGKGFCVLVGGRDVLELDCSTARPVWRRDDDFF